MSGSHLRAFNFGLWGVALSFAGCLLSSHGEGNTTTGLLLRASFDGTKPRADFASGNPASHGEKEDVKFENGVAGLAALVGPEGQLLFDLENNLDVRCGTISFWVKPVDWDNTTPRFHVLAAVESPLWRAIIYSVGPPYPQISFRIFLSDDLEWKTCREYSTFVSTAAPSPLLSREKWTRLDATWDQRRMRLYANGALTTETYFPLNMQVPRAHKGRLLFCPSFYWSNKLIDHLLYDELCIYDRPLSRLEIAKGYAEGIGGLPPRERFDLEVLCHADRKQLHLTYDAHTLRDDFAQCLHSGKVRGVAVLRERTDGREYGRIAFTPTKLRDTVVLPFRSMPVGLYDVRMSLDDGREQVTRAEPFEMPDISFLSARCGVDDTVPPPWKPVVVSGNVVTVLKREYVFGKGPFPESATSEGTRVLSRPVTLAVVANDRQQTFAATDCRMMKRTPARGMWHGRGRLPDGSLFLEWKRLVEYDGMVRCDLIVRPGSRPVKVKGMYLEVAVPVECADYALCPMYVPWKVGGETALKSGAEIKRDGEIVMDFAPSGLGTSIWLTNRRVGFNWFTDSNANWYYASGTKPITITRGNKEAVLHCDLIAQEVEIREPLHYVLGFVATPTKPLPPNWRAVHAEGWRRPKGQNVQHTQSGTWEKIQFPLGWMLSDLVDPEAGKEELASYRKDGIAAMPYCCANAMPDHNPLFDYFGTWWAMGDVNNPMRKSDRATWRGIEYNFCPVCAGSGYADLLTYWTENFMSKYDFGGLYLDHGGTYPCDNARHGCGRRDIFGKQALNFNTFAVRELYRRLYKILHRRGGRLFVHTWYYFYPAVHSFVDITNPGEEFMHHAPQDPNFYVDKVPPEAWESDYNSYIKGVVVQFHAMAATTMDKIERDLQCTRPLLTCCLLHDVPCNGGFANAQTIGTVWTALDRNEVSKAQFVRYHDNRDVLTSNPDLKVSYYRWQGAKRLLIILGNLTPDPKQTRLIFTPPTGVSERAIFTDEETLTTIVNENIEVAGRSFRLIGVKW